MIKISTEWGAATLFACTRTKEWEMNDFCKGSYCIMWLGTSRWQTKKVKVAMYLNVGRRLCSLPIWLHHVWHFYTSTKAKVEALTDLNPTWKCKASLCGKKSILCWRRAKRLYKIATLKEAHLHVSQHKDTAVIRVFLQKMRVVRSVREWGQGRNETCLTPSR